MYFPILKVHNAKHVIKEHHVALSRPTNDYFWMHFPHYFEYQQSLQVEIYCSFKFNLFPFDTNQCNFMLRSSENRDTFLRMLPLQIKYGEHVLIHGQKPSQMELEQSVLPFDITVESLDTFVKFIDGFNISHAGMKIRFSRNNLGLLLGGFYVPMAMFSILSLISYCIHLDNVMRGLSEIKGNYQILYDAGF